MKRNGTILAALALAASGLTGITTASTASAATGTPWAGVEKACVSSTSHTTRVTVVLDNLAAPTATKFTVKIPELAINRSTTVPAGSGWTDGGDIKTTGQTVHVTALAGTKALVNAKAVAGTCAPTGQVFRPAAPAHVDCVGLPKITSAWKRGVINLDAFDNRKTVTTFTINQTGRAPQVVTLQPGKTQQLVRTVAPNLKNAVTVTAESSGWTKRTVVYFVIDNTGKAVCVRGARNWTVNY